MPVQNPITLNSLVVISFRENLNLDNINYNNWKETILVTDCDINNSVSSRKIRVLYNPKFSAPEAINIGIQNSKENVITICGARSFLSDSYSQKSTKILTNNPKIGCVGGRIIHTAHTDTGKAIAAAMGAPLGMGIFSFRSLQKSGFTDTVSVPVFRRDVIEKVGLFDETLIRNQDDDYSYRLKKAGYKIWHEASITSTYFVREKFSQLAAQFFQYGFWKNYVNKKHKTITTLRQLVPPLFLITQFVLLFLSPSILFILLSVYGVVLFTQSISMNQLNFKPAIKTWYAFLVMHYSYGLGYLYGFIYAFILNKPAPESVKKITR